MKWIITNEYLLAELARRRLKPKVPKSYAQVKRKQRKQAQRKVKTG